MKKIAVISFSLIILISWQTFRGKCAYAQAAANREITICQNQGVPDGYVITQKQTSQRCPEHKAWGITKIGAKEMTICQNQAVPDGYVITQAQTSQRCPEFKAWGIRRLVSFKITQRTLQILKSEGFPDEVLNSLERLKNRGFISESEFLDTLKTTIGEKRVDLYKATILKYVRTLEDEAVTVCQNQVIPDGYVITRKQTSQRCPGNRAWRITKLGDQEIPVQEAPQIEQPGEKEITICQNQTIPDGYVITQLQKSWQCPEYKAWRITKLGQEEMTICQNQQVPDSYVIIQEQKSWQCLQYKAWRIRKH